MNKQTSRVARSKKVLSATNEQRKVDLLAKVRDATKMNGRMLKMPPKSPNLNYVPGPSTHEELLNLGNELEAWSKLDSSSNINDFALSKNLNPYNFKRYDNDYFQDKLEAAKYRIASRNRLKLIERQFNEKLYFEELPALDRDVREYREAREDKKVLGVKQALGNITIIDEMMSEK